MAFCRILGVGFDWFEGLGYIFFTPGLVRQIKIFVSIILIVASGINFLELCLAELHRKALGLHWAVLVESAFARAEEGGLLLRLQIVNLILRLGLAYRERAAARIQTHPGLALLRQGLFPHISQLVDDLQHQSIWSG